MTVSLRDASHSPLDRAWIERCYEEFLGDLAADQTGVFPSAMVTGQSVSDLLDVWFRDEHCTPFVIMRENDQAGFALVQRTAAGPGQLKFRLSEFFVREPFRRLGVGREAAKLLFTRFSGNWTVVEQARNVPAVEFWRRIIGAYTGGRFEERVGHGEVQHSFQSSVAATFPGR